MKNKLFLLIAALVVSLITTAGPVEELIKKAGGPDDYPQAGLLVVFDSTDVVMQENGLSFYSTHQLFKVLTMKGGLQLNVLKYYYDPLSAYMEILKVVIYRHDGTKEELDMEQVLDYPQPARAIYWGAR